MENEKGYLILTRRVDEIIMINDNIEIVVMSIVGRQVRLGICAPKDVDVYRHELWEKIQKESGR